MFALELLPSSSFQLVETHLVTPATCLMSTSLSWFSFPGHGSCMSACPYPPQWTEVEVDCCDKMYMLGDFIAHGGGGGDTFEWQERVIYMLHTVVREGSYTMIEAFDVDDQQDVTIVFANL